MSLDLIGAEWAPGTPEWFKTLREDFKDAVFVGFEPERVDAEHRAGHSLFNATNEEIRHVFREAIVKWDAHHDTNPEKAETVKKLNAAKERMKLRRK